MSKTFTLSLVLITVFLVLFASMPAFLGTGDDYTPRHAVREGISAVAHIRAAVSRHVSEHKNWPTNLEDLHLDDELTASQFVENISYSRGRITVEYVKGSTIVFEEIHNKTIVFSGKIIEGSYKLEWKCTEGTMDQEFRPSLCKKEN